MGYRVIYWNRAPEDVYEVIRSQMPAGWTLITLAGDTREGWLAQLGEADFLSVHVPVTDETRRFLSTAQFERMKRSAILINTSRGAVVDEAALIKALETKTIAGAGLDVFAQEPVNRDNPLLRMDNVILTPHIAAGTAEALREKMRSIFANLQRCAEGKPIQDRVV